MRFNLRAWRQPKWAKMLAGCLVIVLAAHSQAHPKPGAHADIRVTVHDRSVRVDLLMNLMFVDGLIYAPRQASDDVAPEEEGVVRSGLRKYFGSSAGDVGGLVRDGVTPGVLLDKPNRVRIDGFEVAPVEERYEIVRPVPETRPGFEQNPLMLIPQVHLVLEYPCKQPPKSVEMVWGTFPLDFLSVDRDTPPPVTIEAQLVAEGDIQLLALTREEPSHTWHGRGTSAAERMARVPTPAAKDDRRVSLVSVGVCVVWVVLTVMLVRVRGARGGMIGLAAVPVFGAVAWLGRDLGALRLDSIVPAAVTERPADDEAAAIFAALHANVYRAFDYATESEVYDALAQSVDGPLLDSMYNQVFRSLVMYEEGGAVSRVKTIEAVETRVMEKGAVAGSEPPRGGFMVDARWRIEGVVYHWGHSHTRWNEYAAEYAVAPTEAGWRIVRCQTREQFRIDPATGAVPIPEPAPEQTTPAEPWHPNR